MLSYEKVMEHYNISQEQVKEELDIILNRPEMVRKYALNQYGLNKHKKFRAIIDYDSDYENFVIRYEFKN